jgi:hypothetical protein
MNSNRTLVIYFQEIDGNDAILAACFTDDLSRVFTRNFVTVEDGSVLDTLNLLWQWTDIDIDPNAQIVVWNFHRLIEVCSKQRVDKVVYHGFMDYLSYYAGRLGLDFLTASKQAGVCEFVATPEERVRLFAKRFADLLVIAENFNKLIEVFRTMQKDI